jgi:ABC-type glycerol-3-phosphate transport system substrate-binding protein
MQAIAMSFGIFKNSKDPEAAMSLIAHLLSPAETVRVMNDSYGQFTPVLDKARAASKDYFNRNDNYQTFARAPPSGSPPPGGPGRWRRRRPRCRPVTC